jgi:anti-sigma-K factor RskA
VTGDPHELIGAYAVDALDGAERARVEEHLTACPDCRSDLVEYREVLAALTTRAVAPPPELEDAVVAAARVGSGAPPSTQRTVVTPPAGPRRRRPATLLAAAAVAAAVFMVGGVVGRATAPVAPVAASDPAAVQAVLAVAAADDAAFVPADVMGTAARVVISDEMGKMAFLAADLPTPAKGECYQVWRVSPDGSKTSAGVFTPDADGLVAVVLDAGPDTESFVITTEPPGGSPAPTGDMVGQVST